MTTIGVFASIFNKDCQILCVKRANGTQNWTMPGGKLEQGETPIQAVIREVAEETGYQVIPDRFIGAYSIPKNDDLILALDARIVGQNPWQPTAEIAEFAFFAFNELPETINANTRQCIEDAFEGRVGVLRVLSNAAA
jgi:8-oxo-dGTP pyrophosphatase MutT (NUDIX family)